MLIVKNSSEITSAVKTSKKPIVLYFTGPNCSACRAFKPIVQEFSDNKQDVDFFEVDVAIASDIAQLYKIRQLPSTVIIKDQKVAGVKIGITTKVAFSNFLSLAGL